MTTNNNTEYTHELYCRMAPVISAAKSAAEGVVIGAAFIGAFGEAEKAGFKKNTTEFEFFVQIFLYDIPEGITVDEKGTIIRLG